VGAPGTTQIGLFIGSGILDSPLTHLWGNFYLEAPWIGVPLPAIPSTWILAIQDTLPEWPVTPYTVPMQALIGDSLTNLFVLEIE